MISAGRTPDYLTIELLTKMDFTLYNGLRKLFDWVIPAKCLKCSSALGSTRLPVCDNCYPELPFQTLSCRQCGQPFAGFSDLCGRCLANPPHFDACFCPFEYSDCIRDLIIKLKYQERPELAHKAAQLLANEVLANEIPMPELLVPVPMHIKRLRKRGFNQANLLARHLGKLLSVRVDHCFIIKSRLTPRQAGLSLKQRRRNLSGSFSARKKTAVKSAAIIDDVVTTGATAGEIAKIMKKKGVDYIQVWGVAHTLQTRKTEVTTE